MRAILVLRNATLAAAGLWVLFNIWDLVDGIYVEGGQRQLSFIFWHILLGGVLALAALALAELFTYLYRQRP